ncbi:MAG: DUF4845 domain-containing protein [Halioglobus sp.]|nr:DUF4845 domain-containing protein [Halioglobus sp.]
MRHVNRQSGISMPGILAILAVMGFLALCVIRMTPPYFEFLSVKRIVSNMAIEPETRDMSNRQIRRRLESIFHSNQIYDLEASEVEVIRKRGVTYIDARYEIRMPLLWRIDAVMRFDDLLYQLGETDPIAEIPTK